MYPLSNVTAPKLKYWTNTRDEERFRNTLITSGLVKPPKGVIVFGVAPLTKASLRGVKPLEIEIDETIDPKDEKNLKRIGEKIKDYLINHPDHVIVIDSNHDYLEAVFNVPEHLLERVQIVDYKPMSLPAPAWVRAALGIFS